jgi:hypothetical protein
VSRREKTSTEEQALTMQRRDLLKLGALGLGTFGLGQLAGRSAAASAAASAGDVPETPAGASQEGQLDFRILAVGFDGSRHPEASLSGKSSVLSEIDLASGTVIQQTLVPIANLHTALSLHRAGGATLLLPLDGPEAAVVAASGSTLRRLTAPQSMLFSGHGVLSADGRRLFLSLRRAIARTPADTGAIMVLEVPSLKQLNLWNSGGVRPHDLVWKNDHDLLISHYGDLAVDSGTPPQRAPRLVTMDSRTGAQVGVIDTPTSGSLTHIAYDGERYVCGVPLHYYPFDDNGVAQLRSAFGGAAVAVTPAEKWEGRLAAPMPALMIDLQDGSVTPIATDLERQRRAQSVIFHQASGSFFITYAFSDVVARVDARTKAVTYVTGFDLGLTSVRGLCALGDSEYLAVSGELNGLAIIHGRMLRVVRRVMAPLYDNPHITVA